MQTFAQKTIGRITILPYIKRASTNHQPRHPIFGLLNFVPLKYTHFSQQHHQGGQFEFTCELICPNTDWISGFVARARARELPLRTYNTLLYLYTVYIYIYMYIM